MTKDILPDELLATYFRITPDHAKALKKLRIETPRDLLYHFPARYQDLREATTVRILAKGMKATIYGKVEKIKTGKAFRKRIPLSEATIADHTGSIKCVWFRQPYIASLIHEGAMVRISGSVSERSGSLYFANPEIENAGAIPPQTFLPGAEAGEMYIPVYPESRGVSSRWIYHHIRSLLSSGVADSIPDPIPSDILKRYSLPTLASALVWIHTPRKKSDEVAARKRFAFEEVFLIQLERLRERRAYEEHPVFRVESSKKRMAAFLARFPFSPTKAQENAITEILKDFTSEEPMMRLLEGDVGSGKTLVAAATAHAIVTEKPKDAPYTNLQVAFMVPTEILARQHFESFIAYFSHLPINIGLITGSECRKFPSKVDPTSHTHISRTQLLKWVAAGDISILVGTHALIQKSVEFKHLAYVIIDEQHRFGVRSRMKLARKKSSGKEIVPHLLSMTATPIPRTLALTIFGDLDLTLLDQMPAGRKVVHTEVVPPGKRDDVYEHIKKELAAGRQAYVICPRIDEPDPNKALALTAKSVEAESKRLKERIFPDCEIGMLHGKMTPKAKDTAMEKFSTGAIDILVATSVVEVGVNVPNATVIVIEGAERFGLSQLHQLRGRVRRSSHQAFCYLFSTSKSETSHKRLKALVDAKNGFELAELDLSLRGAGELSGTSQWGISDIGMDAIQNIKMVEAARKEARFIIKDDPLLAKHSLLTKLISHDHEIHFE